MKLSNEKIMRKAERVLKRTKMYQEHKDDGEDEKFRMQYIVLKGERREPEEILAFAGNMDGMIMFLPFEGNEFVEIPGWNFCFDEDLFFYLENGYQLCGMSLECHFSVWREIEVSNGLDTEHFQGMQNYLAYCNKNGITKQKLADKYSYSGMDVMQLFQKKERNVTERDNQGQER